MVFGPLDQIEMVDQSEDNTLRGCGKVCQIVPSEEVEHPISGKIKSIYHFQKSSRCPKLDGYAIANFGVRVEREVVKIIHYKWSSVAVE